MFILVGLTVLLGIFLVIFALWFIIWTFTMSSSDVIQAMIEEKRTPASR